MRTGSGTITNGPEPKLFKRLRGATQQTQEAKMENENELVSRLTNERADVNSEAADVGGRLSIAAKEAARLTEIVERNGIFAERGNLATARQTVADLTLHAERLDARRLGISQELGGMGRRDLVSARLQSQHDLNDAQRDELKADLEAGKTEKQVEQRAAGLASGNRIEALKTRDYSFNSGGGVAW
jgi:Spy/CpxP family protein refolding chaperone